MQKIKKGEKDCVYAFLAQVERDLCSNLEKKAGRFPSCQGILSKFRKWGKGAARFNKSITEIVNELCIANIILSTNRCVKLEYEPPLERGGQSIDFCASMKDGHTIYYDVKTIHPDARNDWVKFEATGKKKRFPDRVNIDLSREGLGGKIWHNMFASRSKMLDYALELEEEN